MEAWAWRKAPGRSHGVLLYWAEGGAEPAPDRPSLLESQSTVITKTVQFCESPSCGDVCGQCRPAVQRSR